MDTARLIKLPAGSLLLTILTLLALVAVACSTQTTSPKVADLNDRGLDAFEQGKYQEALENFQQALAIAREIGYKALEVAVSTNIDSIPDN